MGTLKTEAVPLSPQEGRGCSPSEKEPPEGREGLLSSPQGRVLSLGFLSRRRTATLPTARASSEKEKSRHWRGGPGKTAG